MKIRRTAVIILIAVLITAICGGAFCMPVQAESKVRIGQARKGERAYKNNKPGDQTGKEVMISDWQYNTMAFRAEHWGYVMRPKDPDKARLIAKAMIDACENDHIGYDQNDSDRGTLYDAAKKAGWDLSKVNVRCETTCSCLISVCLNAAGIEMPRLWMTRDMVDDMKATKQFYCFTSKKYLQSSKELTAGDILINPGKHAVVVVESPHPYTFPVTYVNQEGKKITVQVAEDSVLTLNPNNGEDPIVLTVDREINLKRMTPQKEDFEFLGWRKTSKSSFNAVYKGKMAAILTASPTVKIGN